MPNAQIYIAWTNFNFPDGDHHRRKFVVISSRRKSSRTNCWRRIKRSRPLSLPRAKPLSPFPFYLTLQKYWSNLPHVLGGRLRNGGGERARWRARIRKGNPRSRRTYPGLAVQPRITHRSPLYPVPFYPKIQKRGDLLVCAEAEPNTYGWLLSLSPSLCLFLSSSRLRAILPSSSRIQPPSKPNFSLTKLFLSGNLFRDRNSLSTTTLARYNSGLLNGGQILLGSAIALTSGDKILCPNNMWILNS